MAYIYCTFKTTQNNEEVQICYNTHTYVNHIYWYDDGTTIDFNSEDSVFYTFPYAGEHSIEIEIDDSTDTLGTDMFYGCSNLIVADLQELADVKTLEEYVFQSCDQLKTVFLPENVEELGEYCFDYCHELTSIELPETVTKIDYSCFYSCVNLKNIDFTGGISNLAYIGDEAFYNCESLESFWVPSTVTHIGYNCFYECKSLESFTGKYASSDNRLLIKDNKVIACAPYNLTSLIVPEGVTSIDGYGLCSCTTLQDLTLPSTLSHIYEDGIYDCRSLISITCNAVVAPSLEYSFNGISTNGTLYYPAGSDYSSWMSTNNYCLGYYDWTAEELSNYFIICKYDIQSSSFPTSMTIHNVLSPNQIKSVFVKSPSDNDFVKKDNYTVFNEPGIHYIKYQLTTGSIPATLFNNISNLISVEFMSDSIDTINYQTFGNCSNLESVHIGKNVNYIEAYAFGNCSNLNTIYASRIAPNITSKTFANVKSNGTLICPTGSDYDSWLIPSEYYLGYYHWSVIYADKILTVSDLVNGETYYFVGNSGSYDDTKLVNEYMFSTTPANDAYQVTGIGEFEE